jgi:ribosomal protein S18 acetylase RimI-like enzyme
LRRPDWRVRAVAGLIDDQVVTVGGIAYMPDGSHVAFLHAKPEARNYPVAFHKAGRALIAEARSLGIKRLVAVADDNVPRAEAWLKRLGFEQETHAEQQVWIWHSSSRS